MKKLSYRTLEEQGYDGYLLKSAPERVLQFGEGNFLRAFADYFIDVLNEKTGFNGKVVLVQPRAKQPGKKDYAQILNDQDGLYTLYLRGFRDGRKISDRRVISCVSRCLNSCSDYGDVMECASNPALRYIICNTTEAGIVYDPACGFADTPPSSYPAKLTQFLYRRYQRFGREPGRGFLILACELIDDNGKELEACVRRYAAQWNLGEDFTDWLGRENLFCSTLVDRIATGFPQGEAGGLAAENGYRDDAIDTGEIFAFWAIEGPQRLKRELLFEEAGLPVLITDNYRPYKERKVRILNGAHTSMAPGAYLAGRSIVRDCVCDEVIRGFMNRVIYDEVIPTLSLPEGECREFAAAVTERFRNPFIDHALLSISLNSTSKWRARLLPSLEGYVEKFGTLPMCITASFAFYLAFYRGTELTADGLAAERPDGERYVISDDRPVLDFFYRHRNDSAAELVRAVCRNTAFWGRDLTGIPGLEETAAGLLADTEAKGAYEVMKSCL